MMANHFPDDDQQYFEKFKMMWDYIDTNLIDHEYGEWFQGGIDN
jgi:mannobiose 2-epimerase